MKRAYSILSALTLFAPAVFADVMVSISPSIGFVAPASTVLLDVRVTGVPDLFAFQFDIEFDPAVLSAGSNTEGSFLPGGGATFFIPGSVDNIAGIISFTADTLTGFVPGVNGSGSLALIEFTAIASGASAVKLSNVVLLDSALNDIAAGTANGSVTVSAVPEPGSCGLLCAGLGLLSFFARGKLRTVA